MMISAFCNQGMSTGKEKWLTNKNITPIILSTELYEKLTILFLLYYRFILTLTSRLNIVLLHSPYILPLPLECHNTQYYHPYCLHPDRDQSHSRHIL